MWNTASVILRAHIWWLHEITLQCSWLPYSNPLCFHPSQMVLWVKMLVWSQIWKMCQLNALVRPRLLLDQDWSIVEAVGIPASNNHLAMGGISLKASEIKQSYTGLFCRRSEILEPNFKLVFTGADLLFVWWLVELMEARSETADRPKKKKMKAFSMHKILFGILKNRLKQNKLAKHRRCVSRVHLGSPSITKKSQSYGHFPYPP